MTTGGGGDGASLIHDVLHAYKEDPELTHKALIVLGLGLAFFFGKAYVQPTAPRLPSIDLGAWSSMPALRSALQVNVLFVVGWVVNGFLAWQAWVGLAH